MGLGVMVITSFGNVLKRQGNCRHEHHIPQCVYDMTGNFVVERHSRLIWPGLLDMAHNGATLIILLLACQIPTSRIICYSSKASYFCAS